MKITKHENKEESNILIGMITHPTVMSRIADKWTKEGLFQSKWANVVGHLAVKYFRQYGKPPMSAMQSLFDDWSQRADEDTAKLIEKFLGQVSDKYKALRQSINPDYLIDQASIYFNKIAVKRLTESLESDSEAGNLDMAIERVSKFNRFDISTSSTIDVFGDESTWKEAIEEVPESIIKYDGALGTFFGDDLARDCFVAFMAPEKRGKTWWLIDMAMQGLASGCNVAFFEVGDMSYRQVMRRIATRVAGRPMKPKEIKMPIAMDRDEDNVMIVNHKKHTFDKGLSYKRALRAMQENAAFKGKFLLSVHANSSINVAGINNILDGWKRERNWTPDVIVIDYADILAAPAGLSAEAGREAINATWKALRGLSQSLHCLVVTATQSSALSYKMDTITREGFSEDKRKYAHVTGMLGINSSSGEKEQGLYRLNWVVLRESEFQEKDCVYIAGCLGLGRPAVLSSF